MVIEIYKNLSGLHEGMLGLFNHIMRSENIPLPLRKIDVVPIPKPGKDRRNPNNRRPISLISASMKILEQIAYNRIIHSVEPLLFEGQYAYRRSRSTEHHLAMLMDREHRALTQKHFVYVAPAFDRVPHIQPMRALGGFNIDAQMRRLIRNWLKGRSFVVKYTSPHEHYEGEPTPITTGLPEGGSYPPFRG